VLDTAAAQNHHKRGACLTASLCPRDDRGRPQQRLRQTLSEKRPQGPSQLDVILDMKSCTCPHQLCRLGRHRQTHARTDVATAKTDRIDIRPSRLHALKHKSCSVEIDMGYLKTTLILKTKIELLDLSEILLNAFSLVAYHLNYM